MKYKISIIHVQTTLPINFLFKFKRLELKRFLTQRMLQHDLQHIRYFAQLKHYWKINSQTQLIGYPKISRFLTFIKCQKSCFRFILNKKKGPNVSSLQCIQGTSSVCKRISTLQCIQGTLSIWRGISALKCIQGTTSEIFSKGVENGDFMGLEKVSLKCGSQGQAGTPTKVKLWGNTTLVCLMSAFISELFGEDNRERETSQHPWSTWE